MGTPGRRLGGLAIVVVLVLPAATASTAPARLRQQPCGVGSSLPSPATPRPHYALSVHILPGLRTASGAVAVTFTAPTERGTDRLVLRLWPNGARYARTGAHLFVSRVREGPRLLPVSYPNPTTLAIARPVAAGEQVVVSMNWRLILPRERGLRMKGRGRSVRLGSFFPLLAWDGNDWALDPPKRNRQLRTLLRAVRPLPMEDVHGRGDDRQKTRLRVPNPRLPARLRCERCSRDRASVVLLARRQ